MHTRQWQGSGRAVPSAFFLSAIAIAHIYAIVLSPIRTKSSQALRSSAIMSHSHLTPTASSSNFRLILDSALNAYEERTKNDLISHPLASQLEKCSSLAEVLTILHQQLHGLKQSIYRDERWTKWFDPTVKVICTFSDTLGGGVGLVSPRS